MRILSWNCKGALHRKHHLVNGFAPDIAVIPESEKLNDVPSELGSKVPNSFVWDGNSDRKGLAVISYNDFQVDLAEFYNPSIKWVIPIKVSGPDPFLLLAVWTLPSDVGSYVQPLFEAFHAYKDEIAAQPTLWAGDFNANYLFDKPSRQFKFCDFTELLENNGMRSLYHEEKDIEHGKEPNMTFFLHHNPNKGHHIDYFFGCSRFRSRQKKITLGSPEDWLKASDHVPLICDV